MIFFTSSYDTNNCGFTENPFISNAMLLIPPPSHVSFTKLFLRPSWIQTLITKTQALPCVQKLNHRIVLVKSSMSQPLTSLCIYLFLLPCAASSFNPHIVLIHIQAGYDWLQCHTPCANALCKLKACLNIWNALCQISLSPNSLCFNIWKPEVFL